MLKDNICALRKRITEVCSTINRDSHSITLVGVSKGRTIEEIREVIESGIIDIAENKVQEASAKFNALKTLNHKLRTHLVGHLQTNKAKEAVRLFDLIQSVDSLYLAQEVDKQAGRFNKIQDILIEVKTSPEATKFGLKPDETFEFMREMVRLKNIKIKGLMTLPPIVDSPEKARPYFRRLRELRERLNELRVTGYELEILSMGMSSDFEVAIEEGSNMVRIGRAIFETTDYTD